MVGYPRRGVPMVGYLGGVCTLVYVPGYATLCICHPVHPWVHRPYPALLPYTSRVHRYTPGQALERAVTELTVTEGRVTVAGY